MRQPNRERKGEIKYKLQLNEEQKQAKRLILESPIVVITGRAGSGKSLVGAQTALDFIFKKQYEKILVTRAMVEVDSDSMGFLPGNSKEKFDPYMEAFVDNLNSCYDNKVIEQLIIDGKIEAGPVNFIRGKTINDILIIEEAQNLNKSKMLALLTRLGKDGKIIINGDNAQKDTRDIHTGLDYAIELSKNVKGIEWIKLKENHRHGVVGDILNYEYKK